jgi:hypothetical protein
MSRYPRQTTPLSPSTVPVHDNGDVAWDFPGFKETVLEPFVVPQCLFERQFFPFDEVTSSVTKNLTFFACKVKEKFGRLQKNCRKDLKKHRKVSLKAPTLTALSKLVILGSETLSPSDALLDVDDGYTVQFTE